MLLPSSPSVPRLPVCTVIACLRSQAVQLIFEASNLVEQHHRQRESVTVQRQVLAQLIRALQRHHAADVKDEWIALRRYWFEYAVVQQPLDVGVTEARQLRHLCHRQAQAFASTLISSQPGPSHREALLAENQSQYPRA